MNKARLNFTTIFGAAIAVAVIYYGGLKGVKNPALFLDSHALLLVVGGTMSATFLAFPMDQILQLMDFIVFSVFFKRKTNYVDLVAELAYVNENLINQPNLLRTKQFSHIFLQEGVELLFESSYTQDDLDDILNDRVIAFRKKYQQDAKILNAIAKYPPAFGLLGATTGMIAMMTNLGGAGGTAAIGSAMAVALVATFWGIAAANFVLLPLSDNALKTNLKDEFARNFIKNGVLLIKKGTSQNLFIERLSSMLPLEERFKAQSMKIIPINLINIFSRKPKAESTINIPHDEKTAPPLNTLAAEAKKENLDFSNTKVKKKTGS